MYRDPLSIFFEGRSVRRVRSDPLTRLGPKKHVTSVIFVTPVSQPVRVGEASTSPPSLCSVSRSTSNRRLQVFCKKAAAPKNIAPATSVVVHGPPHLPHRWGVISYPLCRSPRHWMTCT